MRVAVVELALPRRIIRSACGRTLLALLGLVLVLQGLNVGIAAARGHVHSHREIVLVDVRRDLGRSPPNAGTSAWIGHHHGIALRHHHAADDASLVFSGADRAADQAAEDATLSLELTIAAFVALPAAWVIGSVEGLSHRRAAGSGWAPTTGRRSRLERPPQRA